jgi:hypothetical protein
LSGAIGTSRLWCLAPPETRFSPLDEGLKTFLEVLAGEHGLLNGRNGLDGRALALLEVRQRRCLRRTQPEVEEENDVLRPIYPPDCSRGDCYLSGQRLTWFLMTIVTNRWQS